MATGSHGGDLRLLPIIIDFVEAIHLIGPGGQEFWIERSTHSLSDGTEADTQNWLRQAIIDGGDEAEAEMCRDIIVFKDDDMFHAAMVSVGHMGFVYSLVVHTDRAFKLRAMRSTKIWETDVLPNLTADKFSAFAGTKEFMEIIINPFLKNGTHSCKLTVRDRVDCSIVTTPPGEKDFFANAFDALCQLKDIDALLRPALAGAISAWVMAIGATLGAISALQASLPILEGLALFLGPIVTAAVVAAITTLTVMLVALNVTLVGLQGAFALLIGSDASPGERIADIINIGYDIGVKDLMQEVLSFLFDESLEDFEDKTDVGFKIMDMYNYKGDNCQKVESMDVAFNVDEAVDTQSGYLGFFDKIFALFDQLYEEGTAVACGVTLRFILNTDALIGMSKFQRTAHIEIPLLRGFARNENFLLRAQQAAINYGVCQAGDSSWVLIHALTFAICMVETSLLGARA